MALLASVDYGVILQSWQSMFNNRRVHENTIRNILESTTVTIYMNMPEKIARKLNRIYIFLYDCFVKRIMLEVSFRVSWVYVNNIKYFSCGSCACVSWLWIIKVYVQQLLMQIIIFPHYVLSSPKIKIKIIEVVSLYLIYNVLHFLSCSQPNILHSILLFISQSNTFWVFISQISYHNFHVVILSL